MRYFIRKSVMLLRETNPELYERVAATTELLMLGDNGAIVNGPVSYDGEEFVEVKLSFEVLSDAIIRSNEAADESVLLDDSQCPDQI